MPRPFVIAFVARSGSTAIKFDLGQHPQIDMRAEAMGGVRLPQWPGPREQSDDNRLGWLAHHFRPREQAPGFKFQSMQFDNLPRLASAVKGHGACVFRLVRRDRLRQIVAFVRDGVLRPINGGKASIGPDAPPEVRAFAEQPIHIERAAFERAAKAMKGMHARLDAFLDGFDEVTELAYEDYLADRLPVLNRITAKVGVEPFAEAPPSVLSKVTPNDLRLAVANYDEVAAMARELGLRA